MDVGNNDGFAAFGPAAEEQSEAINGEAKVVELPEIKEKSSKGAELSKPVIEFDQKLSLAAMSIPKLKNAFPARNTFKLVQNGEALKNASTEFQSLKNNSLEILPRRTILRVCQAAPWAQIGLAPPISHPAPRFPGAQISHFGLFLFQLKICMVTSL